MKNLKLFLIIPLMIGGFFINITYAEESKCTSCKYEVTFTLGSGTLDVSGYQDAVFNDGAYYSGSSVGATYVEFSSANKSTSVGQWSLGFSYLFTPEHILDLDYYSGSAGETTASVSTIGYSYNYDLGFLAGSYIRPGIAYGWTNVATDLGKVEDYGTMPVIISDGSFSEGAPIKSEAKGNATKFGIELGYAVTSKILGFLTIDIWSTSFEKPVTTIDGKEIRDTTAFDTGRYDAATDTVYYTASSNIDPFASSEVAYKPPMITIGVGYVF